MSGRNPEATTGGGRALKIAIHTARARAEITSDSALALKAGVHYDTLMNWYSERTTPRPHELSKVARALDVPLNDLMAAWEGRPIEPPPVQDAMRELVEEMRLARAQQHEATMALLSAVGALIREAPAHTGTRADRRPAESASSHRQD